MLGIKIPRNCHTLWVRRCVVASELTWDLFSNSADNLVISALVSMIEVLLGNGSRMCPSAGRTLMHYATRVIKRRFQPTIRCCSLCFRFPDTGLGLPLTHVSFILDEKLPILHLFTNARFSPAVFRRTWSITLLLHIWRMESTAEKIAWRWLGRLNSFNNIFRQSVS